MELPQQRAAQTFPGRKIDYTSEKKRTLAAEAKAKITTAKKNGDVPGITLGNVLPWDFSWNYSCDKHTALQSTCTAPKALWAGNAQDRNQSSCPDDKIEQPMYNLVWDQSVKSSNQPWLCLITEGQTSSYPKGFLYPKSLQHSPKLWTDPLENVL